MVLKKTIEIEIEIINFCQRGQPNSDGSTMQDLSQGSVVQGTVTGIKPFGVFVEVDGKSCMLHISQVSSERIADLSSVIAVGSTIKCLVVDVAGLFLVAPLLRLALILPLVDDDALNVLCIDQGLQEPLAVADGDEPLECLRLPKPLDRFQ